MNRETLGIVGRVCAVAKDADGNLLDRRDYRNLVVDAGLAYIAGAFSGDSATPSSMKYIAIGTDDTAATAADVALGGQVESRVAGSQSRVTGDAANDTYQCVATFTMTAARAVNETGLFSAGTGGTMGARLVFADGVMNIPNGGTLQITWQWKFASA